MLREFEPERRAVEIFLDKNPAQKAQKSRVPKYGTWSGCSKNTNHFSRPKRMDAKSLSIVWRTARILYPYKKKRLRSANAGGQKEAQNPSRNGGVKTDLRAEKFALIKPGRITI